MGTPRGASPLRRPSRAAGKDDDLEAWVNAARAGDTDAFGWIWVALSPRVAGYLRARGVSSVDDITSEVFLAAFGSLARFTGNAADFRSWLFTIAHHKSVDDRRRRTDDTEYTPENDTRASVSAESTVLDAGIDPTIRALLAELTDDQREVLLLRTLADMSITDVAKATGRTTGAVKQLYHRAIATSRRAATITTLAPHSNRTDGRGATPPATGSGQGVTPTVLSTMTEL